MSTATKPITAPPSALTPEAIDLDGLLRRLHLPTIRRPLHKERLRRRQHGHVTAKMPLRNRRQCQICISEVSPRRGKRDAIRESIDQAAYSKTRRQARDAHVLPDGMVPLPSLRRCA